MNNKKITIGRAPGSDIRIEERWDTVSNEHAEIEAIGNSLLFYDHSSNGTIINGQKIHNTNVPIYPGDEILLAGVYRLDWKILERFFPISRRPTVTKNIHGEVGRSTVRKDVYVERDYDNRQSGRKTEPFNYNKIGGGNDSGYQIHQERENNYGQANAYSQAEIDKELEKWNWGAFFCTWLWGIFHRMYWPLLILVVAAIPYLGQVCSIGLCVYMGLKGSRIAWDSGKYKDFESYKNAQRNWAIAGLIWFIISVSASAFLVYTTLSMI